jgi:hypothetical protein
MHTIFHLMLNPTTDIYNLSSKTFLMQVDIMMMAFLTGKLQGLSCWVLLVSLA